MNDESHEPLRVAGLGGSLRAGSASRAALEVALAAAADAGAQTELLDLRELDLPLYVPGAGAPPAAERMAEAVRCADGLLWASPLYHGSVSGAFKNAIDWLQLLARDDPPYLTDKVVGLIAVAGGVQGLQAVNTMEFIVRSLRAFSVPLVAPLPRAAGMTDGRITDEAMRGQLAALAAEVVRAAGQLRRTGTCDYAHRETEQD